ncbi:MAG: hypothetical protein WBD40_14995 [Tepidisphaeraceae bacterium]
MSVAAFVLGAYAAGAMLLTLLAVTFPLMNAPRSWETPAAIFGVSMFAAWAFSYALIIATLFQRDADRLLSKWALVLDLLAMLFAGLFIMVV